MTSTSDPLAMAEHWLDVGNPQRCLDLLAEGASEPDQARAFELRSLALIRLGRRQEGYEVALRGLEIDPDSGPLHFYAAQAADFSRRPKEAERHFQRALALCPSDLAIRTRYGAFLVDEKRLAEADRQVTQARELDPEALELTLLRARIAVARKGWEQARALARRVLAEEPNNSEALQLDAVAASELGDQETAVRSMRRAAATNLDDRELALAARRAAIAMLPVMWPLRLLSRFAWWQVALVTFVALRLVRATMPEPVQITVAAVWVAFLVYSWALPAVLTAWVKRRAR
ncbi:hypothetical protein KV102_16075 [Mumia sp. zg.B53]|uniref:tetratricopeptide repeat protein n=1 Tax=Mumia sp. zg.B53 TaxID=2855449 RepID=UPI001C6E327E|nr:hypothetical protein [Mumia sp. zg.B53]MBW9216356.1 hypothetical protein [Mumia sp. zg.B53]